ncbi:MAG: Branched-chain amino acid transport ATP-binding protein LivG [Ramlibacter sp.]|nr:Branched-chain amino acid transport ATP-binding protein LivG [Ramlibacter sp.]
MPETLFSFKKEQVLFEAAAVGVGEAMQNLPVLELCGISKGFGGTRAVHDVSGAFEKGVIYGLIGPNGSGKTTLINLISGFYALDSGKIVLSGEIISKRRPHELASLGVVRTFQMPKAFASLSVLDNVLLPIAGDERSESLSQMQEAAHEALQITGLAAMTHQLACALSGGQTMLLQLARALLCAPIRLLLLDEPFGGVAPALKDRIIQVIRQINERYGATVILVSHEMSTVRQLCSKVVVMSGGRWIAEGTLDEVSASPEVVSAYLGKPI